MARTEDAIRVRLQGAALALFREHGYDRTTAAEIAARAGVTERTFFRHFPDKREVLFDSASRLSTALAAAIAEAPAALAPLDTLFHAFRALAPLMEDHRAVSHPRHEVISATPALAERELAKLASLADGLADALKARGTPELRATLAARTGMAAFAHATTAWLDDPTQGLGERIDLAWVELKMILGESG